MDKLEKFFNENREAFMDEEPSDGHFSRFEEKLLQDGTGREFSGSRFLFLKIAAGLLVLLTVSVFIFDFGAERIFHSAANRQAVSNVPADIRDAVNYYDQAASEGIGTIRKLACCGQDSKNLVDMASSEIKSLDENTAELTKTLREHPGDERIQAALIRNQQMKATVVDHMVNDINKANK
jgi:hypothetical protein